MSEEIIADDDALSAQVLNGTIEVDDVPVDDRGRDEAQAGRTEALVLEGAVSDLALTMKEDRATQRVAGLPLVESGMAALPQSGSDSHCRVKRVRSIRPSARSARDRELLLPAAASFRSHGASS